MSRGLELGRSKINMGPTRRSVPRDLVITTQAVNIYALLSD